MEQSLPQVPGEAVLHLEKELRLHYATTADLNNLETRLSEKIDKQLKWLIMAELVGVTAVAAIIAAVAAIMK